MHPALTVVSLKPIGAKCPKCAVRTICLPERLGPEIIERIDRLAQARRRLERGGALYRAGERFDTLYAIRSGAFKATSLDGEGREQVMGFFFAGDLLGLDSLASPAYQATALALERSEVCPLPYAGLEELAREIVRRQSMMLLLGTLRAKSALRPFSSSSPGASPAARRSRCR